MNNERILKIAGATLNQIPLDWENNTTNILQAIEAAKKEGVKILCLPELCITGYGCEDVFLSDWLSEKAFEKLLNIARHCQHITVSVGLPIRLEGITYNGAAILDDGKILGITLKQNLPREGVHYEPRWFAPWPAGEKKQISINGHSIAVGDLMYHVHGIKAGIEICEDGWAKEKRPGYSFKEQGVDLILNGSASHFAFAKKLKVTAIQKATTFATVWLASRKCISAPKHNQ